MRFKMTAIRDNGLLLLRHICSIDSTSYGTLKSNEWRCRLKKKFCTANTKHTPNTKLVSRQDVNHCHLFIPRPLSQQSCPHEHEIVKLIVLTISMQTTTIQTKLHMTYGKHAGKKNLCTLLNGRKKPKWNKYTDEVSEVSIPQDFVRNDIIGMHFPKINWSITCTRKTNALLQVQIHQTPIIFIPRLTQRRRIDRNASGPWLTVNTTVKN